MTYIWEPSGAAISHSFAIEEVLYALESYIENQNRFHGQSKHVLNL